MRNLLSLHEELVTLVATAYKYRTHHLELVMALAAVGSVLLGLSAYLVIPMFGAIPAVTFWGLSLVGIYVSILSYCALDKL